MKKFTVLLFAVLAAIAGCSKDDNPVSTNSVVPPSSQYGTLVYERTGTDSINSGTKTSSIVREFDYTGSDSIIFVFTANIRKPQYNWWMSIRLWVDSSGTETNYICFPVAQNTNNPEWKDGLNDYIVKIASFKRIFNNHTYQLMAYTNSFIAVRNMKIYKK